MAYTAVNTFVDGEAAPSADWWNTYIRDNMGAMLPEAFTAKGDMLVATGVDAGAIVAAGANNTVLLADSTQAAGVKWFLSGGVYARGSGSGYSYPEDDEWVPFAYVRSEVFDPASVYAPSGNNDIYTAPVTAYYLVWAAGWFYAHSSTTANDYVQLGIYKNGSLYSVMTRRNVDAGISGISEPFQISGLDVISMAAGDTLQIYRYSSLTGANEFYQSDYPVSASDYNKLVVMPIFI